MAERWTIGARKLEYPVRSFVALMLLWTLGSGSALAADVPLPAAEPVRPPIIYDANGPYTNWAGAYLGLNGGYGLGSSQWTLGLLGTSVFDTSGFLFGGTVGFNYPISVVMIGLEGDVDWSGLSGSAANCAVNASGAAAACQTKSNLLGTARARVGYALDRTLIYVTGGAAIAPVQAGLNPPSTFDSATKLGWAAGAGAEFAFSGNWSAKVEYLYIDLAMSSCSTAANCGTAAGSSVAFTENVVRGGFNYRFPW
jgi:outer membrane immunogenic protein